MAATVPELLAELAGIARTELAAQSLPVKADVRLYHGSPPDELECSNGAVLVWWTAETGTSGFPTPATQAGCGAPPLLEVVVRWTLCWPNEPTYVAEMSTIAAQLATGAHAVLAAYQRYTKGCGTARLEGTSREGIAVVSVAPRRAFGGVAGVDWKLRVQPFFRPDPA